MRLLLVFLLSFSSFAGGPKFKYHDKVKIDKHGDFGKFYQCSKKGKVLRLERDKPAPDSQCNLNYLYLILYKCSRLEYAQIWECEEGLEKSKESSRFSSPLNGDPCKRPEGQKPTYCKEIEEK